MEEVIKFFKLNSQGKKKNFHVQKWRGGGGAVATPSHHFGLIVDQVGSVICAGWIRGDYRVMGVGGT